MSLRDLGNENFKAGKYKEAEQLYSQAYVWLFSFVSRKSEVLTPGAGLQNILAQTPKSFPTGRSPA